MYDHATAARRYQVLHAATGLDVYEAMAAYHSAHGSNRLRRRPPQLLRDRQTPARVSAPADQRTGEVPRLARHVVDGDGKKHGGVAEVDR